MLFNLTYNDSHKCPYCNVHIPISRDTYQERHVSFERDSKFVLNTIEISPTAVTIIFIKCPSCKNYVIGVKGVGSYTEECETLFIPDSLAKQFPDYIPESIRQDYEEAYKIVNLSPKASATLARRCLQGMIRDFWDVKDKPNLFQEISAIESMVSPFEWKVLNNIRKITNIGAHPYKDTDINLISDIEDHEAEKLLKVIEYFLQKWYVNKHETEQLFEDIEEMKDDKCNTNQT